MSVDITVQERALESPGIPYESRDSASRILHAIEATRLPFAGRRTPTTITDPES